MPRLSALGIQNLAEAQFLFVDSGATEALDADDTVHGYSFDTPLATIDYAVGLCTASEQSVIIVAPGHAETQAAAAACITADVIGVKILCLGEGALRPTITLTTDVGAIALSVTAANVVVSNLRIVVSKDAVTKAISIAADSCKLIDVEMADNASTTEAAIGILTTAAATNLHIERFIHNGFLAGDACTESIRLNGVARATIKDSWFRGAFSVAAIKMVTAACSGIVIKGCVFENGTTAMTLDVVDAATSKWSVIDGFDVVGGYGFSGGSGNALATDDVSALAAAVAVVDGNTDKIDSATLATAPTSNSLASFIASGGTGLGRKLPASTSLVDIIGAFTGPYDGAAADDNIKSQVDLLRAEVNKIDSVTLDTTPVAASLATFVAGGAGGQGTQLPTSTSLYDVAKTINTVGVTVAPTANTLADTLHKDGSFTYDNTTDSLEALSDKIVSANSDIDSVLVASVGVGTAYFVNSSAADDTGNGLTWATAKKTIVAAVTAAAAGDTIYLKGTAFSEAVTCNKAGMRFVGVGTGPVEATWTMVSLVDSTTDGWCLKITANAVQVENIKFRPPAFVSAGVPTAIFMGTGSDYAVIRNNRFQGRAGSYNAIYGPIPVGNVLIEDNEFIYMNTLTDGRGIYMPASAGVACSAWIIRNNSFNSCVEDINIDGRTCLLEGNIHPIVGLAANNTFGGVVTTKAVDLSGTDTGANVMTKCTLGGTYNLATYTPGTTGDVWMGNFASIVVTVAPNGLTVLVPAA
jgi:hypothetical protein